MALLKGDDIVLNTEMFLGAEIRQAGSSGFSIVNLISSSSSEDYYFQKFQVLRSPTCQARAFFEDVKAHWDSERDISIPKPRELEDRDLNPIEPIKIDKYKQEKDDLPF